MRVLRVHGPGDVRLDTLPDPEPVPHDAVVAVHASGLCGSDLTYARIGGLAGPSPEPLALGHEISGVVSAVGDAVQAFSVGDRVVVKPGNDDLGRIGGGSGGGLADQVLVPAADTLLHRVPEGLDLALAALVEPAAVGMRAAQRLSPRPGERATVMGGGAIGLTALVTLVDAGCTSVVVVDPHPTRRQIALDLGAEAALDPDQPGMWKELSRLHGTHPRGRAPATEVYVEATGVGQVFTDLVNRVGHHSRIVVPGVHMKDASVSLLNLMMKELTVLGSLEYPEDFGEAVDLVARHDLSPLLTDRIPLDQAAALLTDPEKMRTGGKTVVVQETR